MAEIYRNAAKTTVWLGEKAVDVRNAFSSIQIARARFPEQRPRELDLAQLIRFPTNLDLDRLIKYFAEIHDWAPLTALLHRQWFRRKWVIQELAMSRTVQAMLGPDTLDWSILQDLFIYLDVFEIMLRCDFMNDPEATSAIKNINLMTKAQTGRGKLSLPALLHTTRSFNCTNARDHVYALRSMALDVNGHNLLQPDYVIPVEEVFQRFAEWDMLVNCALDFLSCGVDTDLGDKRIPSWVPDLRKPNQERGNFLPGLHFSASGTRRMLATVKNVTELHLKGRLLDEVQILSSVADQSETSVGTGSLEMTLEARRGRIESKQELLKECITMAADKEDGTLSKERFEQFSRTMVWETTSLLERAPPEMSDQFSAWLKYLSECLARLDTHDDRWMNEYVRIAQEIEPPLASFSIGRRFCVTMSGRLGSMPARARKGDKICVLYGGKVLYVIRPFGIGKYQHIGQCYVHGCMHGEAVISWAYDQDIVLV
jgi:Heterokaryon incompatibility protein (HET)